MTAKGDDGGGVLDLSVSRPYLLLILLNLCGLGFGLWRIGTGPADEVPTLILSMIWTLYNMTILGGALAVAFESRQVRANPRVEMVMPAAIRLANGHLTPVPSGITPTGVGVLLEAPLPLADKERVCLLLRHDQREQAFAAKVQRVFGCKLGLELEPMAQAQHVEFIQCTFARADTWSLWQQRLGKDRPLHSLIDITLLGWGLTGVWPVPLTHRLCLYPPREAGSLAPLLRSPSRLPRFPGRDPTSQTVKG